MKIPDIIPDPISGVHDKFIENYMERGYSKFIENYNQVWMLNKVKELKKSLVYTKPVFILNNINAISMIRIDYITTDLLVTKNAKIVAMSP